MGLCDVFQSPVKHLAFLFLRVRRPVVSSAQRAICAAKPMTIAELSHSARERPTRTSARRRCAERRRGRGLLWIVSCKHLRQTPRAACSCRRAAQRCLTDAICRGCIEKLRRPIASSSSVKAGSPAISPHTLTPLPAARALCNGRAQSGRAPPDATGRRGARLLRRRGRWPACTGSGRWCRSTRNRSSAGSRRSISAAAGTSIIAPTSTSLYARPASRSCCFARGQRLQRHVAPR